VSTRTHSRPPFDPDADASTIELREKQYAVPGVTITVTANSREQFDELYRTPSTHPMVKVVLKRSARLDRAARYAIPAAS
jgi:hypothetical protein